MVINGHELTTEEEVTVNEVLKDFNCIHSEWISRPKPTLIYILLIEMAKYKGEDTTELYSKLSEAEKQVEDTFSIYEAKVKKISKRLIPIGIRIGLPTD